MIEHQSPRPVNPRRIGAVILLLATLGITAEPARGIQPKSWEHTNESDFEPGSPERTLVTNFGDLRLTSEALILGEVPEQAGVIHDLMMHRDKLYIAAGPQAKILLRDDPSNPESAVRQVLSLPGEQVFALERFEGFPLLAISGEKPRLAKLDPEAGELETLHTFGEGVRYIWDILVDGSTVYAATGTEGQLLRIDLSDPANPQTEVLLDAEQANLLCLGRDGQGRIYAGSDTDGLVYRVSFDELGQPQPFVLYDAAEPEIGAMIVLPDGQVYVGTADAEQAKPGRLEKAVAEQAGRPETQQAEDGEGDEGNGEGDSDDEGDGGDDGEGEAQRSEADQPQEDTDSTQTEQGGAEAGDAPQGAEAQEPGPDGEGEQNSPQPEEGEPEDDQRGDPGGDESTEDSPDEGDDAQASRGGPDSGVQPEGGRLRFGGSQPPQGLRPNAKRQSSGPSPLGRSDRPRPISPLRHPWAEPADHRAGEPFGASAGLSFGPDPGQASKEVTQPGPQERGHDDPPARDRASEQPQQTESKTPEKPTQPAEPTAEQRDELREVIRRRLLSARNGGQMDLQNQPMPRAGAERVQQSKAVPMRRPAQPKRTSRQGNAIYAIDQDGYVREIFRESVIILRMVRWGESLMVATGNQGQLLQVNPETEETSLVLELEPQQIPALLSLPSPAGQDKGEDRTPALLMGTANPAKLVLLGRGYSPEGTYTSQVLDASQISLWGTLSVQANIPAQTTVRVETRSGNLQEPDDELWSDWTTAGALTHDPEHDSAAPRRTKIASPPARFFQYRLVLTSAGQQTPIVRAVRSHYVTPNLRPKVESMKLELPEQKQNRSEPPPEPKAPEKVQVSWKAEDPNGDSLIYELHYQRSGTETWLPIDDGLRQNKHEWAIHSVPDGYYRVRVTASDAPDNIPSMAMQARRVSEPMLVDNTAPHPEGQLRVNVDGDVATLVGVAVDARSVIEAVHYAVNGQPWEPVLPDDMIYDSTREAFSAKIVDLPPGSHQIAVRITDERGNAHYAAVGVSVPQPEAGQ